MNFRGADDRQLIAALKNNEEKAIDEIYKRYWNRLLAIAYGHLKDKDDAEEAVQDVFTKLWQKRDLVKIDSLPNYLATAVKYTVFSILRRKKRNEELGNETHPHLNAPYEEDKIYAIFLKDYINGLVEQLPDQPKIVFKMSRFEGKKISEIAEELNIAEKTVEAHLSKALKRLRLSLKNSGFVLVLPLLEAFLKQ